MGLSTFSNFTVLPKSPSPRFAKTHPLTKVAYIGLRRDDRRRRSGKHRPGHTGANVVVFGLGGIGLNVIQGARMVGADKIIGVDLNDLRKNGAAASA